MKTSDLLEPATPVQPKNKPVQFVFAFKDGDGKNKQLLGGKGANLVK